ncbi:NAD(P)-dependent oxidoreductase [Spirosoma telluris]|uniref:NAD(P)-dependent oxidoreductase n=1 Tax=Spirosoma telluris TaxID=2183553 RepID=UPI002FC30AD5
MGRGAHTRSYQFVVEEAGGYPGTGTIGQSVRQMLSGFNCELYMLARTDPHADLHSADELKALLPKIDIVVNCLPGTATGFYSADLIEAMQPGSLYANVGRGSTTDEPALIKALQSGHLGGAVLDVTATEPLPTDNPLWTLPNVLLTQHTGGGQPNEDAGKVTQFLRNLTLFQAGEPIENVVELGRGIERKNYLFFGIGLLMAIMPVFQLFFVYLRSRRRHQSLDLSVYLSTGTVPEQVNDKRRK